MMSAQTHFTLFFLLLQFTNLISSQPYKFKIIAFWNASTSDVEREEAHLLADQQTNAWFSKQAPLNNFYYNTSSNWSDCNDDFLSNYDVIILLDARPEDDAPRIAYQNFIEDGGATLIYHHAAFALDCSEITQNWTWFHEVLLGADQYLWNSWLPTDINVHVEDPTHPVTAGLPTKWKTMPNEWYSWQTDLRGVPYIDVLLTIDSSSFPVGTDGVHVLYSNYYPVAWTNKNYNMIYMNWCHPYIDGDYVSDCFGSNDQNNFTLNSIIWLGTQAVSRNN